MKNYGYREMSLIKYLYPRTEGGGEMEKIMIDFGDNCLGCGGCELVCSLKAVKLKLNDEGFWKAIVNKSKCSNCGLCDKICPINSKVLNRNTKGYSFKSFDKGVLSNSASGGFAYEISKMNIANMPICSVQYDTDKNMPIHKVFKDDKKLFESQNSIYLQSYPINGMKEILKLKKGVIIGSPCQIAVIHNILNMRKIRHNYLLIDFFCHGVPSYNIWKEYLNKCGHPINKVQFRSKQMGWGVYSLKIEMENNNAYFKTNRDNDIFYKLFLENMITNICCYGCKYHGLDSMADIRMGDFWGEKYKEDKEGVSAVVTFTEKGERYLKNLINVGKLNEENVADILLGQIAGNIAIPSCRDKMISMLSKGASIKKVYICSILPFLVKRKILGKLGRL